MGKIQTMSASEIKLQVEGQVERVPSESFLAGEWRACTSKQEAIGLLFQSLRLGHCSSTTDEQQ